MGVSLGLLGNAFAGLHYSVPTPPILACPTATT